MYTHHFEVKETLADIRAKAGNVLSVGEYRCEECGTVFPRVNSDIDTILCRLCWKAKYGKK